MKVVFISPFSGKTIYQSYYDKIVDVLQQEGMTVISQELDNLYEGIMTKKQYDLLPNKQDVRDELLRQAISNSDAVIIETTHESFKVGNEATMAIMYGKPTLCLSQKKVHSSLIAYELLENAIYTDATLTSVISDFLKRINHKMFLSKDLEKTITPLTINTDYSVVVFGGVMIDIITQVDIIPGAQQTAQGDSVKFSLGGKAVDAAVGLSRLGVKTYFIGNVGKDLYGKKTKDELTKQNVNTQYITEDEYYSTGTAIVQVDRNGHNAITAINEANDYLKMSAVDTAFKDIESCEIKPDMIYVTLEIPEDIVGYILQKATTLNIPVFLHASPHTSTLTDGMIRQTKFLSVSQKEASKFTGIHVENFETANQAALLLRSRGAKNVIITTGALGSLLLEENAQDSKYFPVKPIQVIDTTASGDAFRAAFISTYLREGDSDKAMRMGTVAGAYAATRFGSAEVMPSLTDISFAKFLYKHYGIKNLIFDYNGVISDDFHMVYDTVMKIFEKYNIPTMTFDEFRNKFTYPKEDFYKKYLPNVKFEELDKIFFENYDVNAKPRLFPRVKEVLDMIAGDNVPMVIMSAHTREKLLEELHGFDIDPSTVFKQIYADVKNKVDTIETVLQEHHFNPRETAYIGDTEHDIEAAKKAGVYSIASTYGYKTTEKLARIVPDIYINSIEELKLFV